MTNTTTNPTAFRDASARPSLVSKVRATLSDMGYANRRLFEIQTGPITKR